MGKYSALKIEQKDVELYVTALSFGELKKYAKVDNFSPDNPDGYQRPVIERRLREIARYVLNEEGVLPTSVVVCIRDEDIGKVTFQSEPSEDGYAKLGTLTIPEGVTLWLVDGQHRFYGVNSAYEKNDAAELSDYPFPITILAGLDRYGEMTNFNIVNTRQKKMPTDIVDRHLVQQLQKEGGLDMVVAGKEKEYRRALATQIADKLNEAPGPWHQQIAIPGVSGRDKGLIRQHALVVSLDPVMKDAWISTRDGDDIVKLLGNYWGALAKTWPEAFASPGDYRVQATVGIYSLHMVLPSVIQLCLAQQDVSEKKMEEIWKATGIVSSFWHKDLNQGADPMTLGTGMASIRALAEYLRGELPKGPDLAI